MPRQVVLLLIGALVPTVTACATSGSELIVLARKDAAVPPMPAELAMATNGKADAPFQVEAALVLASQIERESAAAPDRVVRPASVELARSTPVATVPLTRTAPLLSLAAAPVRTSTSSPAHSLKIALIASSEPELPRTTPAAPIRYADLPADAGPTAVEAPIPVRLAVVTHKRAGRPSAPAVTRAVRNAVSPRVMVATAVSPPQPRSPRLAHAVILHHSVPIIRAVAPFTRIRAFIAGWWKTIRI